MSFANITMKGRLGRDPELKQVGQNQVCKLAVATSERWNDQSGQRQEKTTWHNVEYWGKQAETVAKFFKKGDEIIVIGKVTSDEWTDQQGQKRTAQKVKGTEFDFVGGSQAQNAQPQQQVSNPSYGNIPQNKPQFNNNMQGEPKPSTVDDDIPFNALNGQLAHLI